jgi:hypothetical protein
MIRTPGHADLSLVTIRNYTSQAAQRMCQNRSVSGIAKSIMITMLSQSCSAASGGCHADASTAESIIRLALSGVAEKG